MAYSYNVLREFMADPETDSDVESDDITTSGYWVLAVVRLASPLSYSRSDAATIDGVDFSLIEEGEDSKVIITSDCIQLSINNTKESHTKSLTATLVQSDVNYLTAMKSGDWVAAWIVHTREDRDRIVEAIKNGDAANGKNDGLKFIGRLHSLRKHMDISDDGIKEVKYQFQAIAFKELDTHYIYSQYLADDSDLAKNMGTALAKLGLSVNDIIEEQAKIEEIDNVHKIIPGLLNIMLGKGLAEINSEQDGVPQQAFGAGAAPPGGGDSQEAKQPQFGYLVPPSVFGFVGRDQNVASYVDMMQILFGVQNYDDEGTGFLPSINKNDKHTHGVFRYTGTPMLGSFLILPPGYDNRPLWSILQQFLNPMLNEMYTCMKVAEDEKVYPTLVVRQIPFSTRFFAEKSELKTTQYMNLPRWEIPSILVRAIDIGFSDVTRTNFVWLLGQDPNQENNISLPGQAGMNKPIIDQFDVAKHGLYPIMDVVAVNVLSQEGAQAKQWSEMVADHMIGSQYTLNGTIECVGIQAPICEGDNILFEGIVYHIEGVSHNCVMNGNTRHWTTSLSLSRGMPVDDDNERSDEDENNAIYAVFKKAGGEEKDREQSNAESLDPRANKDDEDDGDAG